MKVKANIIKMLLLFVAKKDPRYYLKGIHFRPYGDKTIVEASNGNAYCGICLDHKMSELAFIVPTDAFVYVFKAAKYPGAEIEIDVTDKGEQPNVGAVVRFKAGCNGVIYYGQSIDAIYPRIAGRFPKPRDDAETCQLDPELFYLFNKGGEALLGVKEYLPIVMYSGKDTPAYCVVRGGGGADAAVMMVMPLRDDKREKGEIPDWFWG